MDVSELLDMADVVRHHMRSKIDERFTLHKFVRDYAHDDVISRLDYGDCCSMIVIDKEQCDLLTPSQIVDYIEREVLFANECLIDLVDGDEWDGQ